LLPFRRIAIGSDGFARAFCDLPKAYFLLRAYNQSVFYFEENLIYTKNKDREAANEAVSKQKHKAELSDWKRIGKE
jgi:hypothetical protein